MPTTGGHPEWHITNDILDAMTSEKGGWDMMIAFPPCTYLAVTANRSYLNNPKRWEKRLDAVMFVWKLWK